ncbi:hypothetical protein CPB83DRAFT_893581 [Crepidotus variabilis]|uniref:Uncharacterized protein n=1 Tax=Crepidotus variabilis TaxID=179855 RepID=A0A9P6EI22_9AGAR|nr:hypothetical protein CPB83DRAFT_893581 [Crepidotus variabilis]
MDEQFFIWESGSASNLNLCNRYIFTEVLKVHEWIEPESLATSHADLFLLDLTRMSFLSHGESTKLPNLRAHCLELTIRVMRWPLEHVNTKITRCPNPAGQKHSLAMWNGLWAVSDPRVYDSEDLRKAVSAWLGHLLIDFFEQASRYRPHKEEIGETFLTTGYCEKLFMMSANYLLCHPTNFSKLMKTIICRILQYFAEQTEPTGLEYLLVAVALFLDYLHDGHSSFIFEEREDIFRAVDAYNKYCDEGYVRKLLNAIRPNDWREWPIYYIHQHPSRSHNLPKQIQANSSTDLESANNLHLVVDISTTLPHSPHNCSDFPQSVDEQSSYPYP